MTTRDTAWAPGTPCWVDNMSTSADPTHAFYAGLFGWDIALGPAGTGGYANASVDGRKVAGLMADPGFEHTPVWTTYLATADIAATCDKVSAAGGTVFAPPMDVLDLGSMAIIGDPTGATVGLWQAGSHPGFQRANEPGSVIWNELISTDFPAAKAFYAEVFGYTYGSYGSDDEYVSIQVNGEGVGGMGHVPPEWPADTASHWKIYFNVADADATAARVAGLGGSVLAAPADAPYGRHADIADGNGATFAILQIPSA